MRPSVPVSRARRVRTGAAGDDGARAGAPTITAGRETTTPAPVVGRGRGAGRWPVGGRGCAAIGSDRGVSTRGAGTGIGAVGGFVGGDALGVGGRCKAGVAGGVPRNVPP